MNSFPPKLPGPIEQIQNRGSPCRLQKRVIRGLRKLALWSRVGCEPHTLTYYYQRLLRYLANHYLKWKE
jgi:hypothetical protein